MLGTPELLSAEKQAAEVNIIGAINVYDAAARHGIPVVQIGTGHKGQPNPYAITKGAAEDLGLARARWLGEKITVVRAYHVYGPGQLPGPPYGPAGVHKFFPTFACRVLSGQPLELCGGGGQLIDPVHVSDVAVALADAISGPYGQVVEAGCGKPVSVVQVAADITGAAPDGGPPGAPWAMITAPGRPGEPQDAEVVADGACVPEPVALPGPRDSGVVPAMASPLVTVVTPTWQRHPLLFSRCVPPVQAQDYPAVEHIVVSDGPDPVLASAFKGRIYASSTPAATVTRNSRSMTRTPSGGTTPGSTAWTWPKATTSPTSTTTTPGAPTTCGSSSPHWKTPAPSSRTPGWRSTAAASTSSAPTPRKRGRSTRP